MLEARRVITVFNLELGFKKFSNRDAEHVTAQLANVFESCFVDNFPDPPKLFYAVRAIFT